MVRLCKTMLTVFLLFCAGSVYASADSTCYPSWKIKQTSLSGCSSTALLSPGNDTRVNLLMLLHDRHGSVGLAGKYSSDIPERRGDAEPFGYSVFALALGPLPAEAEDDETGQFPWGTHCMSNLAGGTDFVTAVGKAQNIPTGERANLAAVRMTLKPECLADAKAKPVIEQALVLVKSKQGKLFARYLVGAAAFYDGDFAGAAQIFESINKPASPWLAEATAYMLGRTALNEAMASAFDEYGSLAENMADTQALATSERGFLGYLKSYPTGRYAASARGLLRRVYWLGKRRDKLIAEYIRQFASGDPITRNVSLADLVQEIDVKLLGDLSPDTVNDPMLLAVLDLRAMRHDGDPKIADYDGPPIAHSTLVAQRARFAGNEALFGYVLAAHSFYVENDGAEVLRLIHPAKLTADSGYLDYSRQLLRALALDAAGDATARSTLVELVSTARHPFQRGSAELALAMHDERTKSVDNVFAANSVVSDPDIREILLRYHAGSQLLRMRVTAKNTVERERRVALYTLLYKQLTRGAYANFVRDLALIPAGTTPIGPDDYESPQFTDIAIFKWNGSKDFACTAIRNVAATLDSTPKDARSLLCLGEFIRLNGLDPDYYGVVQDLDDNPPTTELGGTPSLFAGTRYSRLDGYKAVIADPKSGSENKAYALYRAVQCFAPSGNNGCDGSDIPLAQRKGWFQRLKTDFPNSAWAQQATYYW